MVKIENVMFNNYSSFQENKFKDNVNIKYYYKSRRIELRLIFIHFCAIIYKMFLKSRLDFFIKKERANNYTNY